MWIKECYVPVLKHHQRSHTAEKSFTCSACDKTFTPLNCLLCHKRTHSKNRPLSCSKIESHLQCQIFWSKMRGQALVRNHSTVHHATRHLHHQMVHGFMAFQMILVCGWKNDTWLMAFSFWFFRAYSINEYNVSQLVFVCGFKNDTWQMPFHSDF